MKNILLVFTGGTIGSRSHGGTINTADDARFKLLELFAQSDAQHNSVEFTIAQPLQILSENLHPGHWSILLKTLEAYDLSKFDGIIVTHGTDTLSFTAAMLGVYFQQLDKPLLLVSSNLPLEDPAANGLDNFVCAVEFIRQNIAPGVFVSYRNPGESTQIHLGTRILACLPLSGNFISALPGALFQLEHNRFHELNSLTLQKCFDTKLRPEIAPISLIRPYPGLDYDRISLDGVNVILHDLYHSGTACASSEWGEHYSLTHFIERCRTQNIPVYLSPALYSQSAYESTHAILEAGGTMLWNMTLETAYAKLSLAFGNWHEATKIERFLNTHRHR